MTDTARQFLADMWSSLDGLAPAAGQVAFPGAEALPSVYAVTDLAAASIGAACLAVSRLTGDARVTVDRRLASLWFGWSLRPEGWTLPPVWDPIAGDYRTVDGRSDRDPLPGRLCAVIAEISLGKNCARLDLERRADRVRFEALLAEADLLVHGYRPGALDALGYGESARRAGWAPLNRPGLGAKSRCRAASWPAWRRSRRPTPAG